MKILKIIGKKITKNPTFSSFGSFLLKFYLQFVYNTSNWKVNYYDYDKNQLDNAENTIYLVWHNQLALAPYLFLNNKNKVLPLISPHRDGKIIADIVSNFGYKILSGSSNANSFKAIKDIIAELRLNNNIVLTPDGPRGPIYQLESNILPIALKTQSKVILLSVVPKKLIELKSWDKFKFPLPFNEISVIFKQIDNKILILEHDEAKANVTQQLCDLELLAKKGVNKTTENSFIAELLLILTSVLLFPIHLFALAIRLTKGKEKLSCINQRFALSNNVNNISKVIWIHAASVGESIVALRLIEKIFKRNPHYKISMSVSTISGYNLVREKLNKEQNQNITLHLLPIDNFFILKRFFNQINHNIGILIESELWPNLVYLASKKAPLILASARMSPKSFKRWHYLKPIIKFMLSRFKIILSQSEIDYNRFLAFSPGNTILAGNLKYLPEQIRSNENEINNLRTLFSNRKLILASSTHSGDELKIASIYQIHKLAFPNLLLIIAPRHPYRTKEILNELNSLNLNIAIKSNKDVVSELTDIYIADTLGEMDLLYSLKPITFMGGSFSIGGHNILEPAKHKSAIIFGPDMSNFQEIAEEFLAHNAAIQVKDFKELSLKIFELLSMKDSEINKMVERALNIISKKEKAIESKYLSAIFE